MNECQTVTEPKDFLKLDFSHLYIVENEKEKHNIMFPTLLIQQENWCEFNRAKSLQLDNPPKVEGLVPLKEQIDELA